MVLATDANQRGPSGPKRNVLFARTKPTYHNLTQLRRKRMVLATDAKEVGVGGPR